jgi:hypothetical protein
MMSPNSSVVLPPQVKPAAQLPHWRVPPQPSEIGPHVTPAAAQVVGVQLTPQVPAVLPAVMLQVAGAVHAPQFTVPPQPSGAVPQLFVPQACAAVFAVHPQTFDVPPPPQVWLPLQPGVHVTVPPQVSGIVPQVSGEGHDVSGAQTHMLPALQV